MKVYCGVYFGERFQMSARRLPLMHVCVDYDDGSFAYEMIKLNFVLFCFLTKFMGFYLYANYYSNFDVKNSY